MYHIDNNFVVHFYLNEIIFIMNWIETSETPDKFWSIKSDKFTIVRKGNFGAFELSYDMTVQDVVVLTNHRSFRLDILKQIAEDVNCRTK